MSNIKNANNKQKKSRIALDFFVSIKKTIMDSFSLLSKHDKLSSQMERNNSQSKSITNVIYQKVNNNVGYESDTSNCIQIATNTVAKQPIQTENRDCYHEGQYQTGCMKSTQTWQRDDLSTPLLQDHYPNLIPTQLCQKVSQKNCQEQISEQFHLGNPAERVISTHTNSNICSMRTQEIQTDVNEEFDVNADISRYLGQFNDKSPFRMYSPSRLGKIGRLHPHYYGHDYYLPKDSCNYQNYLPHRREHRWQEDYQSLTRQDYYDLISKPQNDHPPLACYESRSQHAYGMSNESQYQYGFEKANLAPRTFFDMASTHDNSLLLSTLVGTKVSSGDSGSILSSETDSDFIFYPCSSLTQTLHQMTLIDARNTSCLSSPTDMQENVSTNFSWRSDFYGTSLDEVTMQFFLDDDALSDDVFIDDHERIYSIRAADDHHLHRTEAESKYGHDQLYEMFHQSELGCVLDHESVTGCRENYGDNYYAYRYADIDEVLNSNEYCPSENEQYEISQKDGQNLDTVGDADEYISGLCDCNVQCNSDDTYLNPGHEFSDVFDSLRRNSTQTKARKMWRQRRAKLKKKSTDTSNNKEHNQRSMCQPTVFTFDHSSPHNYNHFECSPKPIRGILKNKEECKRELELHLNDENDTYMADITFKFHSNWPRTFSSAQKRESPNPTISNLEHVVEDCKEHVLDKMPHDNSRLSCIVKEINSFENKVIYPNDVHDTPLTEEITDNESNSSNFVTIGENQNQETSSPRKKITEQFNVILFSRTERSRKILTVRKNSVEAYEWTRSL